MADAMNLEIQIKDNATQAASNLDKLAESLGRIKEAAKGGIGLTAVINGLKKLGDAHVSTNMNAMVADFERLANSLERIRSASSGLQLGRLARAGSRVSDATIAETVTTAATPVASGDETISEVTRTAGAYHGLNDAMVKTWSVGQRIKGFLSSTVADLKKLPGHLQSLKQSIVGLHSPLGTVLSQFGRMLRVRLLRNAVKALFSAFKEGYTNLYEWSKLTGGSFAQSIDTATNALGTMKNSVAAAVAPAIEALIPILQTVVSWVNTACNALAQFFALITGRSTWTSATGDGIAEKLDKTKKAATGAGSAMKELLASFDQLNIIASEGGGGGGGGSSTSAKQNFEGLFQENAMFEGWIKDTVTWLEEHLPVVYGVLASIAALVLGLKPGIAISIGGITMAATAGYDMGYNGITTTNLKEAIAGVIASAVGGYLIAGVPGALIGLAIGIAVTLYSYYKGLDDRRKDDLWGDIKLDADQVKKYATSMFTFDIEAQINVLSTAITNEMNARDAMNDAIADFSLTLYKIQIGVDTSTAAIDALCQQAQEVVKSANNWLENQNNTLAVMAQITPIWGEDDEGNPIDISKTLLKDHSTMVKELEEGISGLGKQIAEWYDKGTKNEWKANEADMVKELSERLQRITAAAQQGQAMGTLMAQTSGLLSNLTLESANAVLTQQAELISSYETDLQKIWEQNIANAYADASVADAFAQTAKSPEEKAKWEKLRDDFNAEAQRLIDSMDKSIGDEMEKTKAPIIAQWSKTLAEKIGKAFEETPNLLPDKLMSGFAEKILHRDVAPDEVTEVLTQILNEGIEGVTGIKMDVANTIGINGWDLIGEEMQASLVSELTKVYGSTQTLNILQKGGFTITQKIADAIKQNDPTIGSAIDELMRTANKKLSETELHELAVKLKLTDDELRNLRNRIEGISPSITVTTNVIANVVSKSGNTTTTATNFSGQYQTSSVKKKASGGYVDSGDLYLARENGMNEFIGRIGNQGAVANNDQMVEAMSTGVRDANAEQNALLREQNRLLMQLVNKKIVAELKPSAGVGRSIEQSRQLYARSVGGM